MTKLKTIAMSVTRLFSRLPNKASCFEQPERSHRDGGLSAAARRG